MGVIAVDVMHHAAFMQEPVFAGNDHHLQSFNSYCNTRSARRKPHRSLKEGSWASVLSKSRRLQLHRSFAAQSPVSVKRPISISISSPTFSEPAAAQLLQAPLNLEGESLPAPASGMRTQLLRSDHQRGIAGYNQSAAEDLGLDYKEAAAALEHLFTESPSLENDCIKDSDSSSDKEAGSLSPVLRVNSMGKTVSRSSVSTKRRRKDLMTRITLRKKKMIEPCDRDLQASKRSGAAGEFSDSIWSAAAGKLLRQHGEVVNLMAQNWSKLKGELLSMEEERWLALLMKPAKALQKVRASLRQQMGKEPSDEEWAYAAKMDVATLARHLALHQAARNKLVKMNLRLVRHQARKYEREAVVSSLTEVELCQEGVKGLIVAADRFEPAKGVRFSTYAIFWIRNSILRAQTRSAFPIRAPFNFAEIKMNIKKTRWEMRLEAGEVVDEKTGDSLLKRILERVGVDEERYKLVMRSNRKVVSLHKRDPLTGAELIEHLADPNSHHNVVSGYLAGGGGGIEVTDPTLRLGIDDVLDSLKPKESLVLRQRFGLDGKGERALGEIGRNMRISREMVRRYEARGLLKLKHPTRLAYLRSFLTQDS
eukprot:c23674_g1_i1 orf=131-1912(+)